MLALEWLKNAHGIMEKLEATQLENIKRQPLLWQIPSKPAVGYTRLDVVTQQFPLKKCILVSVVL